MASAGYAATIAFATTAGEGQDSAGSFALIFGATSGFTTSAGITRFASASFAATGGYTVTAQLSAVSAFLSPATSGFLESNDEVAFDSITFADTSGFSFDAFTPVKVYGPAIFATVQSFETSVVVSDLTVLAVVTDTTIDAAG
jgi:hypothetical protein